MKGDHRMLDIYTHILPPEFVDARARMTPGRATSKRQGAIQSLDDRFREMDTAGSGYRQVISLPNPPLEELVGAEDAAELARIGNDSMAQLCARHPDRFPAFVASVSLLDPQGAVGEAERAIRDLGARGVQIFTNVAGKPLDLPEFEPLMALMARVGLPIWLHPTRTAAMTDYQSEPRSRYEMWWCFGWPYETSVAMARLVFSGLFDRHPGLKIITHHAGGMVPAMDGRVGAGLAFLGGRTTDEDLSGVLPGLKRPHLDYFREFYADTALFGSATGLPAALSFFGADRVVFATDAPYGPVLPTLQAIEGLALTPADREAVLWGNAERLLRLDQARIEV